MGKWNLVVICRRHLTNSQVSTALRPFYFLVHPDLFGRWPREQAVNEASLKQLKAHLSVMLEDKRRPAQFTATFFVKPSRHLSQQQQRKTGLKKITLMLASEAKVRKVISAILASLHLPTSYVDSIPDEEVDLATAPVWLHDQYQDDPEPSMDLLHSTDIRRPLPVWLKDNVEGAQLKMAKSEPMRLQTERLQDELCRELDLIDIQWDCGWDTAHKRGVLTSFNSLLGQHEDVKALLANRVVVFGHESGMSIDGQIILYTGEVRRNWLNIMRNIPTFEGSLKNIPLVEKALSQSLRGIQVRRRKNQPMKLVDNYKRQLMQLVTNVNDYLSKSKLPEQWPQSLQDFELCVDNESCPLTLSSTGQFIVPASCPGFLLVPFITESMAEARDKMARVEANNQAEVRLIIKCINELGLIQLDRDESLDSQTMIDCCERLLGAASKIRHLTHGNHLVVSRYFCVNSDGVMCIPWNWKLFFGD